MIQPVILWTDALVFLLVATVLAFILYARNKEQMRAPWRVVVRSRIAMASLVVLSFYTVVGLLDSLHYREALTDQEGQQEVQYSGEVLSLLDKLLGPMRSQVEKTRTVPVRSPVTRRRPPASAVRTSGYRPA